MKGSLWVWTGIYQVYNTLPHPGLLVSIFDPHGEIEEHDGDNDDHDEDREIIDLKLEKEALITESKNFWNQGDLRKRNY